VNADTARSIAVIRTRLPYTDRRALSEAWYSALGLHDAQGAPTHSFAPGFAPGENLASARPARGSTAHVSAGTPMIEGLRARSPRASAEKHEAAVPATAAHREKRAPATAAAASAARTLRYPPMHAAFRLELDGGRVHVVVRREGAVLHVVALCSERHVERVRRALGLAAEHLRLRGELLSADVRAFAKTEGAA